MERGGIDFVRLGDCERLNIAALTPALSRRERELIFIAFKSGARHRIASKRA